MFIIQIQHIDRHKADVGECLLMLRVVRCLPLIADLSGSRKTLGGRRRTSLKGGNRGIYQG